MLIAGPRALFEQHLSPFVSQGRTWLVGTGRGIDQWAMEWLLEQSEICWAVVPYTRFKQPKSVQQLRTAVFKQLGVIPKGLPHAPEDNEFSEQIRQMVIGRYRLLFTIKGRKVHVLHVRGAYVGAIDQVEGAQVDD